MTVCTCTHSRGVHGAAGCTIRGCLCEATPAGWDRKHTASSVAQGIELPPPSHAHGSSKLLEAARYVPGVKNNHGAVGPGSFARGLAGKAFTAANFEATFLADEDAARALDDHDLKCSACLDGLPEERCAAGIRLYAAHRLASAAHVAAAIASRAAHVARKVKARP